MATTPEGEVLAAICEYLTLKGYLFSRTNNQPVYDSGRSIFRALPKYTRRGWPDICLIRESKFYGIEAKSADGRLSKEQADLGRDIVRNGGEYIIARSIDDVRRAGL